MAGLDDDAKLLLNCDGTEAATAFPNSGKGTHSPTVVGNTNVHTAKFEQQACYFDGTSHLTVPDSPDWDFRGDFTVDFWIRFEDNSGDQTFICRRDAVTQFMIRRDSGQFSVSVATTSFTATWTPANNVWYHIAVTRSSNSVRGFVNGTQLGSTTTVSTAVSSTSIMQIGARTVGATHYFKGWMSALRITNGQARWTSNFSVPSSPPVAEGQDFLLAQFNDALNSTSPADTATQVNEVTATGATLSTAVKKFGVSSASFDGTGDWLDIPASPAFDFETGDFTIDFWLRINTSTGTDALNIYNWRQDASNRVLIQKYGGVGVGNILIQALFGGTAIMYYYYSWTPTADTFHHIAWVRSGTNFYLFIDGVAQSGTADTPIASKSMPFCNENLQLGTHVSGTANQLDGYLDEFRVSKTARWTSGFTPPSSAYTTDANTTMLLHFDDWLDSSTKTAKTITSVSGALINGPARFGSGAAYFDGTGDYITIPASTDFDVFATNTEEYTLDFWVKPNSTANMVFLAMVQDGNNQWYLERRTGSGGMRLQVISGGASVIASSYAGTLTNYKWNHVALVKERNGSTTYKMYVNGTLASTTTDDSVAAISGAFLIGGTTDFAEWTNGWMDEIRVSKGVARWTSNFTPPTEPYSEVLGTGNFFQIL